jgi:hypothetical protein
LSEKTTKLDYPRDSAPQSAIEAKKAGRNRKETEGENPKARDREIERATERETENENEKEKPMSGNIVCQILHIGQ